MAKKPSFEPNFGLFGPNSDHHFLSFSFFFFKNLASSVTRYYGELWPCRISEKTNDPILRQLSDRQTDQPIDRQTDGQTDRQMNQSYFIGHWTTNVEHPKINNLPRLSYNTGTETTIFFLQTIKLVLRRGSEIDRLSENISLCNKTICHIYGYP